MEYQQQNQDATHDHMIVGTLDSAERATFIKQTYQHVALAALLFILLEMFFLNNATISGLAMSMTQGWTWLLMLGGFALVTGAAEKWAIKSTNIQHQYWALLLYTAAEAFIFIPMLYIVTSVMDAPELLMQAGVVTLGLFAGLSAVVLLTGKDFSFLKSALTIGTIVAIAAIVGGMIFGFNLGLFFSVAMVILAAGSILYQTSNMVHVYRTDQHVAAALGLFGSLMLLFWYVLSILMRFSGD